jgi:hypothetical protein
MIEITPAQADSYRAQIRLSEDSELVTDVGYFMLWYSAVELSITLTLAYASGVHDLHTFDILTQGMDARVKIERLRAIAKDKIGSKLAARLKYFEEKARPIRNRLAHAAMGRSEQGPKVYFASSLSSMPWKEWGEDEPPHRTKPPIAISPEQLLGWGGWMVAFASDLTQAHRAFRTTGVFEIDNPVTPEPPVGRQSPADKAAPAKARKQPRTSPKK